MKAQIVLIATFALLGCAGTDIGTRDLALVDAGKAGAREAIQQRLYSSSCPGAAQRESTKLADAGYISATAVAFVAVPGRQYAQLDDPTRDWTRDQMAGPSDRCPPRGRKHRYFA